MKRTIIFIFATALLSSCNLLDIEPKTQWTSSNAPTELAHLNGILYGGYNRLGNVLIPGFVTYGDQRADTYYVNAAQQTTHDRIAHSQLDDAMSASKWGDFYEAVKQANVLIYYTPKLYEEGKLTLDQCNSLMGQAYAMRAYTYFWLTRIWGGVPIVEEPLLNSQDKVSKARNSSEEVLAFILSDLTKARQTIPTSATKRTTFNRTAVYAIRAHVHAWKHEYADAKLYCDSVLSNSNYSLVALYAEKNAAGTTLTTPTARGVNPSTDLKNYIAACPFAKMFNSSTDTGAEVIFELAFSDADGSINNTYDSYFSSGNTNPYFKVREEIVDRDFDYRDYRVYASVESLGSTKRSLYKMCIGYARGLSRNLIMLRLADIMLLRAEARINLAADTPSQTDMDAIIADINPIRVRGGGPTFSIPSATYSTYTKAQFLDLMMDERKKELLFEGHRWFDLVRWGTVVQVLGAMPEAVNKASYTFETGPVTLDTRAIVWPVHIEEIRRGQGLIEQNDYYK